MLQNAINELQVFADIKTSGELEIAKGRSAISYIFYASLIQRMATNYDKNQAHSNRNRYPRSINDTVGRRRGVSINEHQFFSYDDDVVDGEDMVLYQVEYGWHEPHRNY